MKIIVADDDPVARLLLTSLLEALHYEVVSCADGEEAWRAYCRTPTPIVISDWRMPGPDGLELCRLIRARADDRTFFLLCSSACASEESQAEARKAGVDQVLCKPLDCAALGQHLDRANNRLGLSDPPARF